MNHRNAPSIQHTGENLHTAKPTKLITLRNISTLSLTEIHDFSPSKIIKLRKKSRLSQAALAKVFNISVSTVRQWEIGDKRPAGASKKLFDLIERKGLEVLI